MAMGAPRELYYPVPLPAPLPPPLPPLPHPNMYPPNPYPYPYPYPYAYQYHHPQQHQQKFAGKDEERAAASGGGGGGGGSRPGAAGGEVFPHNPVEAPWPSMVPLEASWPSMRSAARSEDPSSVSSSSSSSLSFSSSSSSANNSVSSAEMYFSREEIDRSSPSRRDGIDAQKESLLRLSYCSFLQNLGMRLQLPQSTIATAMVLCHRFFLRRSHAAYDRFVIATSCLFLAAKSEETPRPLDSMVLISYEMCHRQELAKYNFRMPNDWFEQFKEEILEAEQLLLTALDFELTVEHPYKVLMTVLSMNGLLHSPISEMALRLVNDGLRSSLWLQFKPHHIAAGAVFLAARFLNTDLFSNGAPLWWQSFQTTPAILDNVVQQMMELYSG